jgi:transcription-repair coupling factor (superfamily II helicase)
MDVVARCDTSILVPPLTGAPSSSRPRRPLRTSVDDVLDPGLATGALAAALRPGVPSGTWNWPIADLVVCAPPVRPYVLSLLAEKASPLVVLTPRTSDAEAVADGLSAFLGEGRVAVFPAWETLPHERLSPQPRTVGRRLAVLDRLCHPDAHDEPLLAIVAPVRAALQPMDPALAEQRPIELTARWDGFDRLVEGLAALGYSRTPQVEARGEFAVRGGIVDLFPTAADHAVRVEFWGDDVESIRTFSVGDQRSTDPVERVIVDPARELVLDDDLRRGP